MFVTGKTLEFECRSRKIMSHRLNPHWMLGTDVIEKIVDIRTCRPNRSLVLTSLWKHSSALCTHLCFQVTVLSFLLLFLCPCLSHTRADTDQSPWLYLRCVLWQNRGKWQRRWRRRRVPGLKANKRLLGDGAHCDKLGWCRLIRTREPRQEVLPLWFLQ